VPRDLKVSAGYRSVNVAWTAPVTDRRPRILDSATATAAATATMSGSLDNFSCATVKKGCTIHGLTSITTYTITITARNLVGISSNSATTSLKPRS
jgi:hypothetical protein